MAMAMSFLPRISLCLYIIIELQSGVAEIALFWCAILNFDNAMQMDTLQN